VRVLIVDDHAAFRAAVAAIVDELDGFVVIGSAWSGEESLDMFARIPADLVLMDVNLPGMTGVEAARHLTRSTDPPVVVLLSTYDDGELDYGDCGAAAYLNKSAFGPDSLIDVWSGAIV
jgi:two-component system response regulator AlgR